MGVTVKVYKCCYICEHYIIDWEAEASYCELPGYFPRDEFLCCCKHFKLKKELKPRKVVKNGIE